VGGGGRGGAGQNHYPDDDMEGGTGDPQSKMGKELSGWRSVLLDILDIIKLGQGHK
jgi:hypothetical protein